ncbi:Catechol 2,3-dioxygenase [Nonlabens sp. Hel1_33_55]|uniref:VOC family protein n=1 Tax=Nonlabens sp. Hel1_33_55 TaxID=1336802 RepID=UPI000875CEA2|nr:VOC family protein [Nonlabens sp. Hel1_33_55]SCY06953.1 Catechol 2,3-dioxygenase [Nonlabens sp. Hel1_33_55]
MPNFSFNHIALAVKDVQKSISFYQSVFRLEEIENTASNSKTRWLSLGEGKQLHLIPRSEEVIKTTKAVHFALSTSSMDSFVAHLGKLDIGYSDWPGSENKDYVRNDGIKQVYFQDPDGYWIEVNDDITIRTQLSS